MPHRGLTSRVEALEDHKVKAEQVYAVHFEGSDLVELCDGTRERMSVAEFNQRYPAGVIIHVVYEANLAM